MINPSPADFETDIVRIDHPKPQFSLAKQMIIERGNKSDWDLLHDLHYKAENLPLGPRFWRLNLTGETIGVLVTGTPKGMLRERHMVFPNIKPKGGDTRIINTQRYKYINANFRVISRFVIDTMYRGIGAGYRMMNLVSRLEGIRFMEIQSSMSKFNVFGQKAGFAFVKPLNANKFEKGLTFFRGHFEANPQDFEAIVRELESLSEGPRDALIEKCREFYYANSALEKTGANRERGRGRVDAMNARSIIKAIQQISLASPMYGIFQNPDIGRKDLPATLPLTAFDLQKPDEKLRTDLL